MPPPIPVRRPNRVYREHEFLTEVEVNQLVEAALSQGRHGLRNSTMILMAYVHGLRVSELLGLRWTQVNLEEGMLHVLRVKRGNPSRQPLIKAEVEALWQLRPERPGRNLIFIGERGSLSTAAFAQVLRRVGEAIDFPHAVHPHMLRHACGYKLANDGCDTRLIQDYLGHRNIQHTVRYTQVNARRFQGLFGE